MNLLNRAMSYDKAKCTNQENCNCEECISVENAELKNQTVEYPKLLEEEISKLKIKIKEIKSLICGLKIEIYCVL